MKLNLKRFLFLSLIIFSLTSFEEKVIVNNSDSCTELIKAIKANARMIDEVNQVFTNSEWLKGVKCYQYEETYFVIASIKTNNDYNFYGKEYVFCGITKIQWDNFRTGLYDLDLSYGERFHKYLIDKECDCD